MKIIRRGELLNVSEINELGAANSNAFQSELSAALPTGVRQIEIDLSQTDFVDCCGLGALVALRNCALRCQGDMAIRLINPRPPVRRIFDLTRMDQVFPIERR